MPPVSFAFTLRSMWESHSVFLSLLPYAIFEAITTGTGLSLVK